MKKIIFYTDGSCIGNPGPGGWAFLIQPNATSTGPISAPFFQSGFSYHTTNNRMEMTAILEALKYAAENFPQYLIELHSDSNLLVQTLNSGWKRKANLDLWAQIDQVRKNLNIQYFWVKAHANNYYNNLCDNYAQKASAQAEKLLKQNPQLKESVSTSDLFKKPGQKAILPSSDQVSLF